MARKVKVDFTGVEAFQRVSEGIHRTKITEIQEKTSQGGDPMLQVAFEVTQGDDKGNRVFDSLVLTDKALWKFKALLQAIGMKCDGKVAVDLDNMIGKVVDVNVFHEDYNGQTRAKISEFLKVTAKGSDDEEDFEDDEEIEEDPVPKKKPAPKKAPAKKKQPDPEPEEDEDEEDDWDEDEDEEEEEPAPKKKAPVKKAPAKRATKKKQPEPEEDEDDDDDDWEED